MTVGFDEWCANEPFSIRKDAQPPRDGAFAKASRKADFAQGFGGWKPSTSRSWPHDHCLQQLSAGADNYINQYVMIKAVIITIF
ncbi:MAG: hypothetical protein ABF449_07365 [Ethanoligenens sp.]